MIFDDDGDNDVRFPAADADAVRFPADADVDQNVGSDEPAFLTSNFFVLKISITFENFIR